MIDRFYFSYDQWECFQNGLYETKLKFFDEEKLVLDCVQTLSCSGSLYEAMMFVTHHWVKSAHQHLSNTNRNRQAWLGQAACLWIHGAPEIITKKAWQLLDKTTQDQANSVADEVIKDWENKHLTGYWKRVKNIQ